MCERDTKKCMSYVRVAEEIRSKGMSSNALIYLSRCAINMIVSLNNNLIRLIFSFGKSKFRINFFLLFCDFFITKYTNLLIQINCPDKLLPTLLNFNSHQDNF